MKREDLISELDRLGVSRKAYDLNGGALSERYCLERVGDRWSVFYSERGFRNDERTFDSEDEANTYLFEIVKKDETTRRWT